MAGDRTSAGELGMYCAAANCLLESGSHNYRISLACNLISTPARAWETGHPSLAASAFRLQFYGGDFKTIIHLIDMHLGGGVDHVWYVASLGQHMGQGHGETAGMSCAYEFLRVAARSILEAGGEAI